MCKPQRLSKAGFGMESNSMILLCTCASSVHRVCIECASSVHREMHAVTMAHMTSEIDDLTFHPEIFDAKDGKLRYSTVKYGVPKVRQS